MNLRHFSTIVLFLALCLASGCEQALNKLQDPQSTASPQTSAAEPEEPQPAPEPVQAEVMAIAEPPATLPTEPLVPFSQQTTVTASPPAQQQAAPFQPQPINICSFNIQFLGNPKNRDNAALANLVGGFDIVVVQELVAPPIPGTFPDGTPYKPDAEAAAFFDAMQQLGFSYILSEEDTGSGDRLHINSSSTEWWVAFYRADKVQIARDLPGGYLAEDRSNHADYERVPYAFPFRSVDGSCDFVLVSVHLQPNNGPKYRARRKRELGAIARWIDAHDQHEKDFIILGDMNIENVKELADTTPPGFLSLNDECRPTNTQGTRPYDHVMYCPASSREVDQQTDMQVIDLVQAMKQYWNRPEPYPGTPYNHNKFRAAYSDHHPVWFRLMTQQYDDDQAVAALPPVQSN